MMFSGLIQRRRLASVLLACAAALSLGEAGAQSPALVAKATDRAAVIERAQRDGKVPVIVEFAAPEESALSTAAEMARHKQRVRSLQDDILRAAFGDAPRRVKRMRLEPMFALEATPQELDRLAADPRVVRIHPDTPDRPSLNDSVPLIGMREVQKDGGRGHGQIVAILDTGVAGAHAFLTDKVVLGACFASNASGWESTCPGGAEEVIGAKAGEPCKQSSECSHGTTVAGVAVGRIEVADPVKRGVAPMASVLAINVYSHQGGSIGAFVSDQVRALEFVFERRNAFGRKKIAAVNMSLGGSTLQNTYCDDDPRASIIRRLRQRAQIATTIASGNEFSVLGVSAPGCISHALTVGATTKGDIVSDFSNGGMPVDMLAPGEDIVAPKKKGFGPASGTSFAAPHVAGAIAALRSLLPEASVDDLEQALEETGQPIDDDRSKKGLTKPRIQVDAALEALQDVTAEAETAAVAAQ